jgi:tetratricopeptide (TPR) repeat protein
MMPEGQRLQNVGPALAAGPGPVDKRQPYKEVLRTGFFLAALGAVFFQTARAADGPAPLLRAAAAETRTGEEAYLLGRADEAVPALREAARLYLAAGNIPEGARALVNVALAERAAGDAAAARATATRLRELTPAAQQQLGEQGEKADLSRELACASAWLQALLALDRRDLAVALSLIPRDPGLPATSLWPARLATLRAEIELADDRLVEALVDAVAGQKASAAARDRAEEARAWRLAGAAHLQQGKRAEARSDFLAAVKIEEILGGGARMAGDLGQLAAIAEQLGDHDGAQLYTRRSATITAARTR